MNSHLLDDDDDLVRNRNERELTLSTGSILGIFFGLALICGLFFGFGYNMGHKSSPQAPAAVSENAYDSEPATTTAPSSASKPSAGMPATASANVDKPGTTESAAAAPEHAPETQPVAAPNTPAPKPVEVAPAKPAAAAHPASASSFGTGNFVVQVAAVSHQEDADLLVNALQHKGYSVAARSEPGDKLVHIQVGPFSDRKEADAMRNRLITDGYNAMIKQI